MVRYEAAMAMPHGLGFEGAASRTVDARILKIGDRYGSLEAGKVATWCSTTATRSNIRPMSRRPSSTDGSYTINQRPAADFWQGERFQTSAWFYSTTQKSRAAWAGETGASSVDLGRLRRVCCPDAGRRPASHYGYNPKFSQQRQGRPAGVAITPSNPKRRKRLDVERQSYPL